MKAVIIYAHPNENSFNSAIKSRLESELEKYGHEIRVRDLYKMNFDPILSLSDFNNIDAGNTPDDIKKEQEHIMWADAILFVYPLWWENMPAIMRGYIDRVFAHGFAYQDTDKGTIGLLKGKKAAVIQTAGASERFFKNSGMGDAMDLAIDTGIFRFCGIEPMGNMLLTSVSFVGDNERKEMLNKIEDFVKVKL